MPPINMMIKPASGNCNMRCTYCFYADETKNRETKSYGIMSLDTLEKIVERTLSFADADCTFVFQGGEPTLAGLDFFKQLMALEEKYNIKKIKVHNSIQTNGYAIDDNWAAFFAEKHFLVGLSLDGPKELHDSHRIDFKEEGTYKRIMHTTQLFDKYHVEYNILTVVTAQTAKKIEKTYNFFKKNHFAYQQYIPCLDPLGEKRGGRDYSLTPEAYQKFLCTLFDIWYNDSIRGEQIYIRYFDNLLQMLKGYYPESCGMLGVCGKQFVAEADGSVYPCDFYALDEWKLGNLVTDSFEQIEKVREQLKFIEISQYIDKDCKKCKWGSLCRGGCRRDREPMNQGFLSKNYFCTAYYNFFEYAVPRLQYIIRNQGFKHNN
jgi:uncharacterized protein